MEISDEALRPMAGGDARTALNALELAVESTPPDANSVIHIDDNGRRGEHPTAGACRPRTPEDISAFIKSVRGSFDPATCYRLTRLPGHPDAALYWLPKALAGEDPEFVMRRLLILPDLHKDRRFYNPSDEGYEAEVKERVEKGRGAGGEP